MCECASPPRFSLNRPLYICYFYHLFFHLIRGVLLYFPIDYFLEKSNVVKLKNAKLVAIKNNETGQSDEFQPLRIPFIKKYYVSAKIDKIKIGTLQSK